MIKWEKSSTAKNEWYKCRYTDTFILLREFLDEIWANYKVNGKNIYIEGNDGIVEINTGSNAFVKWMKEDGTVRLVNYDNSGEGVLEPGWYRGEIGMNRTKTSQFEIQFQALGKDIKINVDSKQYQKEEQPLNSYLKNALKLQNDETHLQIYCEYNKEGDRLIGYGLKRKLMPTRTQVKPKKVKSTEFQRLFAQLPE